jgi:hypothetical protein
MMIAYGKKPLSGEALVVKTENGEVKPKVEDKKPAETQVPKPLDDKKTAKADEPQTIPKDKILTPKRPYNIDALFKEVEKEMEDLMKEMRGKIKK